MTYEEYVEEVKYRLSKMTKTLRNKIQKISDIKGTEDFVVANDMVKKITDTMSDREADTYDCWVDAMNAIYRRRGALHLAAVQLKLKWERITTILKLVREYEEKVNLLNILAKIDSSSAKKVYEGMTKEEGVCKIELGNNGEYKLSVSNLKKVVGKQVKEYNEDLLEGKALVDCLYEYAAEYNLTSFIGKDIEDAVVEIKRGFAVAPELMEYYNKYTDRSRLFASVSFRMTEFSLEGDNDTEPTENKNLLMSFDEAQPPQAYYNYGLFKI